MAVVNILIGAGLLLFGRRAFWLFVAGAGFVAGLSLANNILEVPESIGLIIGIGIGLLAALLAVFVQRFAISLAGFLVGGYIALQVLPMLNLDSGGATWLAFIVGGVIGVILVGAFLDWALIILSSLAGSSLLVEAINLPQAVSVIAFIVLVAVGISVQAKELKREKR